VVLSSVSTPVSSAVSFACRSSRSESDHHHRPPEPEPQNSETKRAFFDTGVLQRLYNLQDKTSLERANLSADIVSTLQAGCFVGALLAAQAADRFGRRPVLIWGAGGISVIGVILQAAASGKLPVMFLGR
jgi:MFS family permease